MEDATTSDRERFLAFELALDEMVSDEVRRESWGRVFLTPSLPLIWDASWVAIEQEGLGAEEVVAIADEVLGGTGFAHRTVAALDEADGLRLAEEIESDPARWPGWKIERVRYMAWRGGEAGGKAPVAARETTLAEIEGLRKAITLAEGMPNAIPEPEETAEQLFELDRRYSEACGDSWFAAPAEGESFSCCRLFLREGIAQVEDVGTLAEARERGYAKAIVSAAVAAARARGAGAIFLVADAADWPQLMYAKLGFEEVGDLTILRRRP